MKTLLTCHVVSVAFRVANWSSRYLNTAFYLMSDMLNVTCAHFDLFDEGVLLRGRLTEDFDSLLVTITMATSISFGPSLGQPTCHPMPSSLLTHQESGCNQTFCALPTTCRYLGNEAFSTVSTLWQYDFVCPCSQPACNELLLWFHRGSLQGTSNIISLCEVEVRPLWLLYQFLDQFHDTTMNCWCILCNK